MVCGLSLGRPARDIAPSLAAAQCLVLVDELATLSVCGFTGVISSQRGAYILHLEWIGFVFIDNTRNTQRCLGWQVSPIEGVV